jgi:hypothetical protein
MGARQERWISAQVAAGILDLTSAEVCRLLSIGRLTGTKQKTAGRPGKAQWLVNPTSITKEKRYRAKHEAALRRRNGAKESREERIR